MEKENSLKLDRVEFNNTSTKICVPLTGKNVAQIITQCEKIIANKPDLIEWRVDFFDCITKETINDCLNIICEYIQDLPIVFTLRKKSEGGMCDLSSSYREEIICNIIRSKKIDLVDIELDNDMDFKSNILSIANENSCGVIFSNHNFEYMPTKAEILITLNKMQDQNCHLAKIAYMPKTKADLIVLLDATIAFNAEYAKIPICTIAMGELGVISRISGPFIGCALTYAMLDEATAPGQLSIKKLKTIFEQLNSIST